MRFAPLLLLFLADVALAQPGDKKDSKAAPAAKSAASWKGQRVMSKTGIVRLKKLVMVDDDGEPVYETSSAYETDYVVRDEQNALVLLRTRDRVEGWVEKESLVPLKEAVDFFGKALADNPESAALNRQLRAHARRAAGDLAGAIDDLSEAIRLENESPELYDHRAVLWTEKKEYAKALADIDEAIRLKPDSAVLRCNRAYVRLAKAEYAAALTDLEDSLKSADDYAPAYNALAWVLATCPDDDVRNGRKAVTHAEKAVELTERKSGAYLDTLAAAYAEARRFDDAVRVQQEALRDRDFVLSSGNPANERLDLYRQRKAYRTK
jgi:tetratricopeptide (TPR) repeat protein